MYETAGAASANIKRRNSLLEYPVRILHARTLATIEELAPNDCTVNTGGAAKYTPDQCSRSLAAPLPNGRTSKWSGFVEEAGRLAWIYPLLKLIMTNFQRAARLAPQIETYPSALNFPAGSSQLVQQHVATVRPAAGRITREIEMYVRAV